MNLLRLALVILLWILFLFPSHAEELDRKLYSIFKEKIETEKSSLKFEILDSSYAEFNFVGGFADGRYRLVAHKLEPLGEGIFKLYFLFEKKRGIFSYRQKVLLYFWQGSRRVVFLTKKGKKSFKLPEETVKVIKTKEGYEIVKKFPVETYSIPLEHARIYLKVKKR